MKNYGKVSGRKDLVAAFYNAVNNYEDKVSRWNERLRREGYKAAHPNDGWVDRENKKIHFAYPYFNDGAKVGDRIMIGFAGETERPVMLTGKEEGFVEYFNFEDL